MKFKPSARCGGQGGPSFLCFVAQTNTPIIEVSSIYNGIDFSNNNQYGRIQLSTGQLLKENVYYNLYNLFVQIYYKLKKIKIDSINYNY